MKNNNAQILKKIFIVFILSSLLFTTFAIGFADARSSKKESTYEIRSELKESTKEQVVRSGSCSLHCEVDHKIPLKCGGSNDQGNLQSLPDNVHQEKTNREAKLCTSEHPELTCGGLQQVNIDGFLVYMCANAGLTGTDTYTYSSTSRKSYSTASSSKSSSTYPERSCYVSGYTTKKGTYVNGYYRRC
jgi:hypothetical protein